MRLLFITLSIVYFSSSFIFAQNQKVWEYINGDEGNDDGESIAQNPRDGSYYVASIIESKLHLVKLSEQGSEIWLKKLFDFPVPIIGIHMEVIESDIVLGYTYKENPEKMGSKWNYILIRFSSNGDVIWSKKGGEYDNYDDALCGISIKETNVYCVVRNSKYENNRDFVENHLLCFDSKGNIISDKKISNQFETDWFECVQKTKNGGFILTGYSGEKFSGSSWEIRTLKLDSKGNREWRKSFRLGVSRSFDVRESFDDGFVVFGYARGGGTNDVWLIKLDSDGNKIWEQTFGTDKTLESVTNGFVVKNNYMFTTDATSNGDIVIRKFDNYGNYINQKIIGYDEHESINHGILNKKGNFVLVGKTKSKGAGESDVWVIEIPNF